MYKDKTMISWFNSCKQHFGLYSSSFDKLWVTIVSVSSTQLLYQVCCEVFCNDLATGSGSGLMKSIVELHSTDSTVVVDDLCSVAWETECASQHLSADTDRSTYKHLPVSLLGRLSWSCSRNMSVATVIQPRVSSYKKKDWVFRNLTEWRFYSNRYKCGELNMFVQQENTLVINSIIIEREYRLDKLITAML